MQVALGKAQQPAFVSKSRARWADTRRRFEVAAEQLDQTGSRADRELARDVRAFLQERPTIETVPDRVLRKIEQRLNAGKVREAQQPQKSVGTPEKGQRQHERQPEPRPAARTPPTRRR
jgi:type IV secretion system T-DNA border endonuclease VirD2